ncbi:MAG: winged helix-turn-helix domain-containing protein [Hyphomicrobiales bacterium]|nr:winged helix-turn-helix domain-containing protein [Hyphomicrobiales bacterium]
MPLSIEGSQPVYALGECEINIAQRELRIRGLPAPIGGRAFEFLEVLVRSAGKLVTKDELMSRIWPGAVVMEHTLQVHAGAIRKALGPHRDVLKTESRRGYRLLGDWTMQNRTAAIPPIGPTQIHVKDELARTNVALAAAPLIGRSADTQRLLDFLSAYRVVTLTGPGGIGKTTLALHLGRKLLSEFADGCWFVELASLSDPALVPSAVASVLGLMLIGNDISSATVAGAIGRQRMLLILDNCEHVIDVAAELVEAIVSRCPNTTLLTTSREVLRADGEHVYRVPPLAVPPREAARDILDHSAVELFVTRAKAFDLNYTPIPHKLPLIADICRRLDGIPLAIEFAAARMPALGLERLAIGLDNRFDLLTSGRRTALPRHRTLRAMLDWSYDLLTEEERALLCRLAIFRAGFTLDGAGAVSGGELAGLADGIASLLDKSLVAVDPSEVGSRWRLLETIRSYAVEKLAERGEADEAARRHATYFRDLIASAVPDFRSRIPTEELARCSREVDNVRAALDWSFGPGRSPALAVSLTIAAIPLWEHLSLMEECRGRVEQALAALHAATGGDTRLEMQLNAALGGLVRAIAFPEPNVLEMLPALAKALQLAESLGDVDQQLRSLWGLWLLEDRKALRVAQQFSALATMPADRLVGERMIGSSYHFRGNQRSARHHIERALVYDTGRGPGSPIIRFGMDHRLIAQAYLVRILWLQGFPERALRTAESVVERLQVIDHANSRCTALAQAACRIALWVGNLDLAEQYIGHLHDVSTTHALTLWRECGRAYQGLLFIKRGDLQGGISLLRAGFDALYAPAFSGYRLLIFIGELAEALGHAGQVSEGLVTVEKAIDRAERTDEGWIMAELLRIKGELLLLQREQGAAVAAEDHFRRALDVAHQQDSLSWELRAATSMARLLCDQDRSGERAAILQQVYGRFTEGFDTADVRAARAILGSFPT